MEKLDKDLVKKSFDLISEKYFSEPGKKFILHLVSSFLMPDSKVKDLSIKDINDKNSVCCITKCKLAPSDAPWIGDDKAYYGVISGTSDKSLSKESLKALKEFVEKRLNSGDDVLKRIYKYINKDIKSPQSKSSKPKNKEFKESKAESINIQAIPAP